MATCSKGDALCCYLHKQTEQIHPKSAQPQVSTSVLDQQAKAEHRRKDSGQHNANQILLEEAWCPSLTIKLNHRSCTAVSCLSVVSTYCSRNNCYNGEQVSMLAICCLVLQCHGTSGFGSQGSVHIVAHSFQRWLIQRSRQPCLTHQ